MTQTLREWAASAELNARRVYFTGNLAEVRDRSAHSRVHGYALSEAEHVALEEAADAWDLYEARLVTLVQKRNPLGGHDYLAVKLRRR